MADGISVIVLAYNEEPNIQAALESVQGALGKIAGDHQIIVVDDGSTDRTGDLARAKAALDLRICVVAHDVNKGFGVAFRSGLEAATKEYLAIFPGDNDVATDALDAVIGHRGQAELIIGYPVWGYQRPWYRYFISRTYVIVLNLIFGLKLQYYNGIFIFKKELLKGIRIRSTGFSVISECLVKLLKQGCSYREFPFKSHQRLAGHSKAFSWKNISGVVKTVVFLVWEVYWPGWERAKGKT